MFICGSGSFGHQDHEDEVHYQSNGSPCTTPNKRSKRSTSFCRIIGRDNTNKNPYADRGLDKFYALLADLDDKKQKIYTQMGSEDISFVRFVYTNDSNNVKPIVVKVKEKKESPNLTKKQHQPVVINNQAAAVEAEKIVGTNQIAAAEVTKEELNEKTVMKKKRRCLRCDGSFRRENLRRPSFYFPVIVVLILLFLAMYGRSFAILCTSIGWYMVPTVVGGSSNSSSANERKPKRKEYVRRQSEKKMVHSAGPASPKSVISGPMDNRG